MKHYPFDLDIASIVSASLAEDVGSGDITAALIDADKQLKAEIITRENAVLCGIPWAEEVFRQLDAKINIHWEVEDGDSIQENQVIAKLSGSARTLITGERTALNFLQTLSGTATLANRCAGLVQDLPVKILDTRKTIPGLRLPQKYAIRCGGGHNHRFGLYDTYLIKENHIKACGSITKAVKTAKQLNASKAVEVEVESLEELEEALQANADIVMLDNFSLEQITKAVAINNKRTRLEVSGNVTLSNLRKIAETGVDFISLGTLTKNINAIDLSMRFI